jgi:hypothetical protein
MSSSPKLYEAMLRPVSVDLADSTKSQLAKIDDAVGNQLPKSIAAVAGTVQLNTAKTLADGLQDFRTKVAGDFELNLAESERRLTKVIHQTQGVLPQVVSESLFESLRLLLQAQGCALDKNPGADAKDKGKWPENMGLAALKPAAQREVAPNGGLAGVPQTLKDNFLGVFEPFNDIAPTYRSQRFLAMQRGLVEIVPLKCLKPAPAPTHSPNAFQEQHHELPDHGNHPATVGDFPARPTG